MRNGLCLQNIPSSLCFHPCKCARARGAEHGGWQAELTAPGVWKDAQTFGSVQDPREPSIPAALLWVSTRSGVSPLVPHIHLPAKGCWHSPGHPALPGAPSHACSALLPSLQRTGLLSCSSLILAQMLQLPFLHLPPLSNVFSSVIMLGKGLERY